MNFPFHSSTPPFTSKASDSIKLVPRSVGVDMDEAYRKAPISFSLIAQSLWTSETFSQFSMHTRHKFYRAANEIPTFPGRKKGRKTSLTYQLHSALSSHKFRSLFSAIKCKAFSCSTNIPSSSPSEGSSFFAGLAIAMADKAPPKKKVFFHYSPHLLGRLEMMQELARCVRRN